MTSLNHLRFLFNRRDKIIFLILLFGMIVGAFFETFSIAIIPAFIGAAVNPEKVLQYAPAKAILNFLGISGSRDILIWGCSGLGIIFAIKSAYICLQYYFQVRFVENRKFRLTRRLFTAYMNAPYQFHIQCNSSGLIRNTTMEVGEIMGRVLMPLLSLTMQSLMMVAILVLLFAVQPAMALVAMILLGFAGGGFQWMVKKKLSSYSHQAQKHRELMIKSIQQGLGAIKELRILRREKSFVKVLEHSLQKQIKATRFQAVTLKITAPYMELIAVFGLLTITILLLTMGKGVDSIAPTLVLFAASFVKLKAGIGQMVNGVNQIRYGVVSIDPVYNDLKLLEKGKNWFLSGNAGADRSNHWHFSREIKVENVNFRYPNSEEYALRDIQLNLAKDGSIALVGETGSGKTTLVDVILGLLEPESGRITVDGQDIHINLPAWQTNIGYIPQFIYLTDESIRCNIALGVENAQIDDSKLWSAIQAAQLESFVQTLAHGVDTIIGENGIKLSGGQRQRIGIARALYHNPEVLIMDEATSALDNATEKAVLDAVDKLRGVKTVIMIAHRLTTVKKCDTLYFLKNGRIECSGSYEALRATHEDFRKMAQMT